jgi:hypothetical protein
LISSTENHRGKPGIRKGFKDRLPVPKKETPAKRDVRPNQNRTIKRSADFAGISGNLAIMADIKSSSDTGTVF